MQKFQDFLILQRMIFLKSCPIQGIDKQTHNIKLDVAMCYLLNGIEENARMLFKYIYPYQLNTCYHNGRIRKRINQNTNVTEFYNINFYRILSLRKLEEMHFTEPN